MISSYILHIENSYFIHWYYFYVLSGKLDAIQVFNFLYMNGRSTLRGWGAIKSMFQPICIFMKNELILSLHCMENPILNLGQKYIILKPFLFEYKVSTTVFLENKMVLYLVL